jgi:pimeloyl-ACP methyl ester carboxylesterase
MSLQPETSPPTVGLFHREYGPEGAPASVILHGMLGSSRNWQTVAADLAASRRVYALDLRNHGMSAHAPAMSYGAMAADVAAWLDANGVGPAEFIGHSMGGKVAMLLACRQPARVGRLVVVDIAPREYRWAGHRAEFAAMQELDLAGLTSRAEAEMRMEGRVPDWAMRKFITTNLERLPSGGWKWQVNLPALVASLTELERNPLGASDRFDGPALFIAGAKSTYIRPQDHAAILGHFPSARIEVLPASGHNPHIDGRAAFVRALGPPVPAA